MKEDIKTFTVRVNRVLLLAGKGLGYPFRRLALHGLYADRFPWTIVKHGHRL